MGKMQALNPFSLAGHCLEQKEQYAFKKQKNPAFWMDGSDGYTVVQVSVLNAVSCTTKAR